jgi:hypothetical protein
VKVLAYPPSYVRTGPTKNGKSLYWESGCVFVTVDAAGTTAIPGDDELAIIDASIDEWNNRTADCSYLKVINEGRKALEVGNDKVNLIKFRDTPCTCEDGTRATSWGCRPAVGKDPAHCYAPQAAGITTAVYVDDKDSSRDGAIIDADIELNGVNFAISVNGVTTSSQLCQSDLQNTLTHELGHLHGLEHPCLAPGDPERLDNLGNPVPPCGLVLPGNPIRDSTMYNFQDCGEIAKRSLAPDDINAICEIYPTNNDPDTCDHVGQRAGCCSAAGQAGDRPGVSLLLAASTVLLLLRRRKPSPNP